MKKASFIFIAVLMLSLAATSGFYRIVESLKEEAFFDLYENDQAIAKNVNYQVAQYGRQDKLVLQTTEQKIFGDNSGSKTHYQVLDFNRQLKPLWQKTIFDSQARLLPEYDGIIEVTPTPDWLMPNKVKMYDLKTGEYILSYQTDMNPYSKERPLAVQVSWFNDQMKPSTYFVLLGAQELVVDYGNRTQRMHFMIYNQGVRTRYALQHPKGASPISFEGFTCENMYLAVTDSDNQGALTVVQRSPDYIAITSALVMSQSPEVSGFEMRMTCFGMEIQVPVVKGQWDLTKVRGLKPGFELILL